MFSKILLKLIDQAIIPAIVIFFTRVVSILFLSEQYKLNYTISQSGINFINSSEYIFVNSFSIFITLMAVFLGMVISLLMSHFFHQETISPLTTTKLFTLKMSFLIKNSFEIYTKMSVWVLFLWLITFYTGLMFINKNISDYVFYYSLILSIFLTVLMIRDIENKIKVLNNKDFNFDTDKKFLDDEIE